MAVGSLFLLGTSSSSAQTIRYSKPIVIFKGGVYRGNWQSLDPKVAAVTISTPEPVTIEYSNIKSRGRLIYSAFHNANLTVRNSRGQALNPNTPLKDYKTPGRFVHLEQFRNVKIENNELSGTSGIYLREFTGKFKLGQTIKILRNKALNIDGRYSIGKEQYSKTGYHLVQFVQFNQIKNVSGAEIAWNQVINEPGKSRVEEIISMYLSSGVPSSSIKIHNNYLQGAFNVQPTKLSYGGSGMNLGDGSSRTVAGAAAYIRAFHNQIVGTNSGIAMSAGHNLLAYENRLISSGYLPDGRAIAGQNVGIYVWDIHNDKRFKTFYNVVARDNIVGWSTPLKGRASVNPFWFPDCSRDRNGRSLCQGNVSLPGPITLGRERQEYVRWQAKLRASKVRIGVLPPGR
ncbi:hypothetical protein CVO96_17720 [Deinococcus koreensis]|uniref:Right handed beta helix domain-containing protein n=2 Tax=Deinococcus koreensis TaxID=2054903 RepID=A0A2K3UTU2_9DEIO|nr:hypothetical protein CVO96_17720 [Deinococcus koreensis]